MNAPKGLQTALYVVVALGIAAGGLALWGKQRLDDRKMISTMANGINIYTSISSNESSDHRTFALPQTTSGTTFATSTDYLRGLVASGYMNVEFGFFSAPGIMPPDGIAPEQFIGDFNAWCVVADITPGSADAAPVLFTRNLMLAALDERPRLSDAPPFGKRGAIVIQKDAKGRILKEDEIEGYFSALGMNNQVLRP
ncbi:MAG: hypothetical protein AB7V14_06330 [Kiritimatiellia bacterium]